MKWFAHRVRRSLLVLDITVDNRNSSTPFTTSFVLNKTETDDFSIKTYPSKHNRTMFSGTITTPEEPGGPLLSFAAVGNTVKNISVEAHSNVSVRFITAFRYVCGVLAI